MVAPPLAVVESESHPQAGEQTTPPCVRVHATPCFFGSYPTVAANFCVVPPGSKALTGVTETLIAGTVIVAEPEAAPSATDVAVTVTVRSLGGNVAGAV